MVLLRMGLFLLKATDFVLARKRKQLDAQTAKAELVNAETPRSTKEDN